MAEQIMTPQQEAEQTKAEALVALSTAKAVVIKTPEDYKKAGEYFKKLKDMLREIKAKKDKIIKPIKQSIKDLEALFEPSEDAINQALAALEPPMIGFKQAEARRIQEAEEAVRKERERLEAEARAAAKAEEEKLERAHQEAEAARKAAEELAEDDPLAAMLAQDEADEAEKRAATAFAATQAAIREAASVVVPGEYVPKTSAAGTSFRTNWKWEIEDASQIPREMMMPNETLIGSIVRSQKDKTKIPGIRVFPANKIGG